MQANTTYHGMLQRLNQLVQAPTGYVPPMAPASPMPVMQPDQLTLTPGVQPVYVPYPMPYPVPPQPVIPALPPAMATPTNPLGVAWVGNATAASPQAPTWTAPPAVTGNPLGVDWVTAQPTLQPPAAPAPPPAQPAPASSGGSLGSRAVEMARRYLGVPYLWGGSTPRGFDCSGLMQFVFRHLGVSIPRVAADQFRAGREVSRDALQPGDAVFFRNTGSRTGITHVGMYLGGGRFLHAPKTGDVVKISGLDESYWQSHYAGARRYG